MKRYTALLLCFVALLLSCTVVVLSHYLSDEQASTDVILIDGHLTEVEKPMDENMLGYAVRLFDKIYTAHLKDNDCYFALVPDKYRYLTDDEAGYRQFYDYVSSSVYFATPIELYDLLDESDYYYSDIHWKQECITDVAQRISTAMGEELSLDYTQMTATADFVGNYTHRSELEALPDELVYLSNDMIDALKTDDNVCIYDFKKLNTQQMYDFFLSGNQSIVTIKNDSADSDKRLVIFRDSFACSIAPLLCENYSEVVLVDLRYIMSDMLPEKVNFENADVLFLYSTTLLNNSLSMR